MKTKYSYIVYGGVMNKTPTKFLQDLEDLSRKHKVAFQIRCSPRKEDLNRMASSAREDLINNSYAKLKSLC